MGVTRIQKVEWLTAFFAAHDKAVSPKNIHGGFRGTGIHPFLPTKVLRRLMSSLLPQPSNQPPTLPNPTTPFNAAVLTSSPIDFNAIHQANLAINTLFESGNPIPFPAKNDVNCLTRSVMCLHTRNILIEKENKDQKAVLGARKRRLSGKRRVIDGKHLMTAEELIGIREAEEATRKRKA